MIELTGISFNYKSTPSNSLSNIDLKIKKENLSSFVELQVQGKHLLQE